jgi:prolyl 4-hydroxylase
MARARRHDCPEAPDRLYWLDGFLEPAQCEAILAELEFTFWQPSRVYAPIGNGQRRSVYSRQRVSSTTSERWFSAPLRRTVATIDRRIARLLPQAPSHREPWQATKYGNGGYFKCHHDSGSFGAEPAGERTHTVLLYLDTPRRGGSTWFPLLDFDVKSVAGRLLVWSNLEAGGKTDPEMMHAAQPLFEGHKTTLVTWIRQRECLVPRIKRRSLS